MTETDKKVLRLWALVSGSSADEHAKKDAHIMRKLKSHLAFRRTCNRTTV